MANWYRELRNKLQESQEAIVEHLPANASKEDFIHDFVHSDNERFSGKSKEERIKMALGAWYKKNEGLEEGIDNRSDRKVISDVLDRAMEKGYTVSVKDGNEWVVRRSMDKDEIMGELGQGQGDYLLFRKDEVKVGSMSLAFGKGDVISNFTANPEMEFLAQGLDEPVAFAAESADGHGFSYVKPRLVDTFHTEEDMAKVYKNPEDGEYTTKFWKKGIYQKDADYHTSDKDDAIGTAKAELKIT